MEYSGELPSCIYVALVVLTDNTIKSNQVTSSPQFFQQLHRKTGLLTTTNTLLHYNARLWFPPYIQHDRWTLTSDCSGPTHLLSHHPQVPLLKTLPTGLRY